MKIQIEIDTFNEDVMTYADVVRHVSTSIHNATCEESQPYIGDAAGLYDSHYNKIGTWKVVAE